MTRRIEDIELKLAYLERANEQLSDLVFRQQQVLDALGQRLQRLAERLEALEEGPGDYTAGDEAPPHY